MNDLKAIPTEQLINELSHREGIKKIAVGPYKDYRLETKYEPDGSREIISDTVLIFNSEENKKPMERKEQIASKIAKLLETEKCTVSESQTILREAEAIINNSTFTVQYSKPVKQAERVRGEKPSNSTDDPFEAMITRVLSHLNQN